METRVSIPLEVLVPLVERWRADPVCTYQTWFLWEERGVRIIAADVTCSIH